MAIDWKQKASNIRWTSVCSSSTGQIIYASSALDNLYKSTDYGESFSKLTNSPQYGSACTCSSDGSKVIAYDNSGGYYLYISTDGGSSWTSKGSLNQFANTCAIKTSNNFQYIVLVVNNGYIWISTDYGDTWTQKGESRGWRGCTVSDDGSKMIAVEAGGRIWASTDYGSTWSQKSSGNGPLTAICGNSDLSKCYICKYGGKIFTTTDLGVNLSEISSSSTANYLTISCDSDSRKILAGLGDNGVIVSEDEGSSWTAYNTYGKCYVSVSNNEEVLILAQDSSNGYVYISRESTPVAPTVTTQDCTSIGSTGATGNGNITATGGADCTRRGFCYMTGTSGDPTTANSVAYDDGTFGTGAYTKAITGLSASTGYRVRAYAVNTEGTSYGTTVQLTTAAPAAGLIMMFE